MLENPKSNAQPEKKGVSRRDFLKSIRNFFLGLSTLGMSTNIINASDNPPQKEIEPYEEILPWNETSIHGPFGEIKIGRTDKPLSIPIEELVGDQATFLVGSEEELYMKDIRVPNRYLTKKNLVQLLDFFDIGNDDIDFSLLYEQLYLRLSNTVLDFYLGVSHYESNDLGTAVDRNIKKDSLNSEWGSDPANSFALLFFMMLKSADDSIKLQVIISRSGISKEWLRFFLNKFVKKLLIFYQTPSDVDTYQTIPPFENELPAEFTPLKEAFWNIDKRALVELIKKNPQLSKKNKSNFITLLKNYKPSSVEDRGLNHLFTEFVSIFLFNENGVITKLKHIHSQENILNDINIMNVLLGLLLLDPDLLSTLFPKPEHNLNFSQLRTLWLQKLFKNVAYLSHESDTHDYNYHLNLWFSKFWDNEIDNWRKNEKEAQEEKEDITHYIEHLKLAGLQPLLNFYKLQSLKRIKFVTRGSAIGFETFLFNQQSFTNSNFSTDLHEILHTVDRQDVVNVTTLESQYRYILKNVGFRIIERLNIEEVNHIISSENSWYGFFNTTDESVQIIIKALTQTGIILPQESLKLISQVQNGGRVQMYPDLYKYCKKYRNYKLTMGNNLDKSVQIAIEQFLNENFYQNMLHRYQGNDFQDIDRLSYLDRSWVESLPNDKKLILYNQMVEELYITGEITKMDQQTIDELIQIGLFPNKDSQTAETLLVDVIFKLYHLSISVSGQTETEIYVLNIAAFTQNITHLGFHGTDEAQEIVQSNNSGKAQETVTNFIFHETSIPLSTLNDILALFSESNHKYSSGDRAFFIKQFSNALDSINQYNQKIDPEKLFLTATNSLKYFINSDSYNEDTVQKENAILILDTFIEAYYSYKKIEAFTF